MSTPFLKNYLLRAKSALDKNLTCLTLLDRLIILAGRIPAKTGLIYDQLQFPDLSIQEIERLSDFQGGFYYPPKHRRKSMAFLIKAVEKGTLLN